MEPRDRIILPLDAPDADAALRLAEALHGYVGAFKVGLELVNAAGTSIFSRLHSAGVTRIFYDAKFHDIPNTVAGACRAATRHGLWMVNLHASGGSRMIAAGVAAARQGADERGLPRPIVLAVTLLTSLSALELACELRGDLAVTDHVAHMAALARAAGVDGVVASPNEVAAVREACGGDFLIVTPGVRPADAVADDQRRVMTPAAAIALGADYLVIGRPITAAANPVEAARRIADEIATA